MQRIKRIDIPQPCHQSWDEMTRVGQGRHCQSCCKTVVDFTTMSNADIIAHFVSHKNVCGRIGADKLAAINFDLTVKSKRQFSWKGLIALATLSILFPIVDAKAQTTKVKHATAKKIASKEPLIFERAKERLSARAPVKIEIAVSPNGTVVPVKLDIKTEPAHTMLGGMVAGVKVSSVYEWWRDELIRIF